MQEFFFIVFLAHFFFAALQYIFRIFFSWQLKKNQTKTNIGLSA